MEYKRVFFRIADLEPELLARTSDTSEKMLSRIAKRDLERLYMLYRLSLPKFTIEEARILIGALNGVLTMPQTASLLWANVEDYLRGQGLGNDGFVERLRAFTPFECMAIEDAVERFYSVPGEPSLEEQLLQVGLVKKEATN